MSSGHVRCDKCSWFKDGLSLDEIMAWHNRRCPDCDDCVIITDKEMALLRVLSLGEAIGVFKLVVDEAPADDRLIVRFDTASLRGERPA